jgi:hypothetical protein
MSNAEDNYKQSFGLGTPPDPYKTRKALEHALDIRKFEIGLYWQRAAYFWALIAAAFAGYFAILGAEKLDDKEYLAFIVACIGELFTWAWFLVNRGSKQWQENWENHVDMLEDTIVGPLYKTLLDKSKEETSPTSKYLTGPLPISVSKINQWVSTFTLCIWGMLVCHSLTIYVPRPLSWESFLASVSWRHIPVGGITVLFAVLMWCHGQTDFKVQKRILMRRRDTRIT